MARGVTPMPGFTWRLIVVATLGVAAACVLVVRLFYLQIIDRDFLEAQGNDRFLRTVQTSAHRGSLTDRNGEPLAVSTPVDSIWANPTQLRGAVDQLDGLANALKRDRSWLERRITSNLDREFVYLKRHLNPDEAAEVLALRLPGVFSQREYRRYYPAGEVAGHLVGFTDIDDQGQEGLELAYNYWLRGEPGTKRVIQDRLGRIIEDVESVKPAKPGQDFATSIDLRLQYLAYRELKVAMSTHGARSGSIVLLDVATGEVLAMVNQPSFNPNNRRQLEVSRYRNRAVTDIFEPGSSFKPFVVAAALETGRYGAATAVNTEPGFVQLGANRIEDDTPLGKIDVATILKKSSNVGAIRIALDLEAEQLWSVLHGFGIGQVTGSGFPGESAGVLNEPHNWRPVGQATLAYGYGLAVTPLQLARAFAMLGNGGRALPVSLARVDTVPDAEPIIEVETAAALIGMLEQVVTDEGTGGAARIPGYRIAGKTGTAWKSGPGGYSKDKYRAVFAGLAPASAPRIAAVVVIDEPRAGSYYGGEVAAPVFAQVVTGALRILAVPPDGLRRPPQSLLAHLSALRPETVVSVSQ